MKATFTLLLTLNAIFACGQIDLKYNLKKGQSFKILTVADQEIEQDMMDTKMQQKQNFTMGTRYDIIDVSSDGFDITCTYYRVAFYMSAMGMEMGYNSEDSSSTTDPMSAGFAALVNKSFGIRLNFAGDVIRVTGVDEMLNAMVDDMDLDDDTREIVKMQMKGQFGEESLKNTLAQSFKYFPSGGKATKGEEWTFSTNLGMYDVDMINVYVLETYDARTATISVSSEIEMTSFSQENQGMEMEMEMKGSQNGQIIVDRKSGMIISGEIIQDLTATANMMGMTIPMTIKSLNTFSREK